MQTITFPNLGFQINIDPELFSFQLFGYEFSVRWYGLLIAVGFMLAVFYCFYRAKKMDIDTDRMLDVALVSTIFAFIGARLYYVLFSGHLSEYLEQPWRILNITEGGLAIYGGVLVAFVTGLWMCRLRKVDTLKMFDLASLGFLIGQCVGRWGNFVNQEAFGTNTDLPWAMSGTLIKAGVNGNTEFYDPSLPVHPTFLYESLWCLLGFLVLHFVCCKAYKFKGQLFSMYLMWYGAGRFFLEGLRTDSLYLNKTIRVSQMIALLSVLGGLILFFVFKRLSNRLPKTLEAEGISTISLETEMFEQSGEDEEVPADLDVCREQDADASDDVVEENT